MSSEKLPKEDAAALREILCREGVATFGSTRVGFGIHLRASLRGLIEGQSINIGCESLAHMEDLKRIYAKELAACKGTVAFIVQTDNPPPGAVKV